MSAATLDAPKIRSGPPEWIDSEALYEIIDGEHVEKEPMSAAATGILNRLTRILSNATVQDRGEAFAEMLIELPGSNRNRRPDAIYVSYNRWPKGSAFTDDNAWPILPEICIEVASPTDRYYDVLEKMTEYFEAGVMQVWIVTPPLKRLEIYRSPAESNVHASPAVVDCSAVIPGFVLHLAEVFG